MRASASIHLCKKVCWTTLFPCKLILTLERDSLCLLMRSRGSTCAQKNPKTVTPMTCFVHDWIKSSTWIILLLSVNQDENPATIRMRKRHCWRVADPGVKPGTCAGELLVIEPSLMCNRGHLSGLF